MNVKLNTIIIRCVMCSQMRQVDDSDSLGNPVGKVQEFTVKHRWPPALYTFTDDFLCTVRVIGMQVTRK